MAIAALMMNRNDDPRSLLFQFSLSFLTSFVLHLLDIVADCSLRYRLNGLCAAKHEQQAGIVQYGDLNSGPGFPVISGEGQALSGNSCTGGIQSTSNFNPVQRRCGSQQKTHSKKQCSWPNV